MEKPWEFNGDRVIVFGDIHQRVNWAKEVLRYESGNYDKIVFLGDMADSHFTYPEVSGIRETAAFHRELVEMEDCLCLLGNHDAPLCETARLAQTFQHKRKIFNVCSGFTRSKSIEYAKEMTPDHWKKVKLFTVCNGWLLSHAGMPKWMWDMGHSMAYNEKTPYEIFKQLWLESERALDRIAFRPHEFFRCGHLRGGDHERGSIIWADIQEFRDNLPLPQIFGHSSNSYVRQIGRSYCIDTGLTYLLVNRDGSLEFKNRERVRDWSHESSWIWLEAKTKIVDETHLNK
jgi:hypothetical protein